MANKRMIDNPLKPSDEVGEHRRPGDFPYCGLQWSLDDGPVVTSLFPPRRIRIRSGWLRYNGCARSSGLFCVSHTINLLYHVVPGCSPRGGATPSKNDPRN